MRKEYILALNILIFLNVNAYLVPISFHEVPKPFL